MKIPKVKWQKLAADDFMYKYVNYYLRVEQMDVDEWWWSCKIDNIEIAGGSTITEYEAKLLCEVHFLRHIILTKT